MPVARQRSVYRIDTSTRGRLAHPFVRLLFEAMEEAGINFTDLHHRTGVRKELAIQWGHPKYHNPTVISLEKALAGVGYELAVRKIRRNQKSRP